MYDSAIMKHHIFDDRHQEDPLPQYARGFASTRVPHDARDAFAANDDFVPFVADIEEHDTYRPLEPVEPEMPDLPFDCLT